MMGEKETFDDDKNVADAYASINPHPKKKLTQREFDDIIEQHDLYRNTKERFAKNVMGKRGCLRGYDLSDFDLRGRNWSDFDFSYDDISNYDFSDGTFHHTNFFHAIANGTIFKRGDFFGSNMKNMLSVGGDYSSVSLSGVDADYGNFLKSNFSGTFAQYLHAKYSNMDKTDQTNAKWSHSNFDNSSRQQAIARFVEYLECSVIAMNARASDNYQSRWCVSNLSRSNHEKSNMQEADFSYSNIEKWKTAGAYINGAVFRGCQGEHIPFSVGPIGQGTDFYTYNPQDQAYSLPKMFLPKNGIATPIPAKDILKLAKSDAVLKEMTELVKLCQKTRTNGRN